MKLTIKESNKNYACSVVEIKELFPIEGADAICRVVINGRTHSSFVKVILYF